MRLNQSPNLIDPDGFYDEFLRAHEGLDAVESEAIDARLILTLANPIGNRNIP